MASGIIIGGDPVPVSHPDTRYPIPVFAWCDPPGTVDVPEFKAGDGYNKERVHDIDLCVWHWTGGEAEPDRMAETLRRRKLGVEFAISRHGAIFQFCDPLWVDTADAGSVNHRSVGVEIINYGFRRWWKGYTAPRIARDRQLYQATTHGRTVKTAHFYEAQTSAALALADALHAGLGVPRRVPPLEVDSVYEPALLRDESRFQGHVGHYHVSKKKRDPGPALIEALDDHFADAA